MTTNNRCCERCGGAIPKRTHRSRDDKGMLVCDSCARTTAPDWGHTIASLTEEQQEEMRRRQVESVVAIQRAASMQTVAHDSGDSATIYHCPFCGSGQVIGGHDGTVACEFCKTHFTVQVQPEFQAMPQTINGQPYNMPGMPGGGPDAGAAREQEAGAIGENQAGAAGAPEPGAEDPDDEELVNELAQMMTASSMLLTADGVALPLDKAMQHIAIKHADDRASVIASVRQENGVR